MNVISSHSICSFGHLGILSILRPLNSPSSVPRNNRYYDLAPAVNFSFKSALNAKTYFPIKLKITILAGLILINCLFCVFIIMIFGIIVYLGVRMVIRKDS